MRNRTYAYLMLIPVLLLLYRCEEEEEKSKSNPGIWFKETEGYTYTNTAVKVNDSIKVGILAESNGTDNLIDFVILRDQQIIESISMDRASLDADVTIEKGIPATETWKFIIWDKGGRGDSIWLTLTIDGSKRLLPPRQYYY